MTARWTAAPLGAVFVLILTLSLTSLGCAADVSMPETCLLAVPDGATPEGGWPVFVLLHGYGTNKEDFTDLTHVMTQHGVAAVSVDAPEVFGPNRRQWGRDIEKTHIYLSEQIQFLYNDARFVTEQIHLGGFSQGGIRSLLLVAHHPEIYGGAYSLSPAGGALPESPQIGTGSHPLFMVYGTAENAGILSSAERAQTFWSEWGQPTDVRTHGGGHHFPSDWADVTGVAVRWIVETTSGQGHTSDSSSAP